MAAKVNDQTGANALGAVRNLPNGNIEVEITPRVERARVLSVDKDGLRHIGVRSEGELRHYGKIPDNWVLVAYKPNTWVQQDKHGPFVACQAKATYAPPPVSNTVLSAMLDVIASKSPIVAPIPRQAGPAWLGESGERYLLEVSPFDLHLGKYAWRKETGETYDVHTAVKGFIDSLDLLLERAKSYPVERVLFVMGNDFLHIDNPAKATTNGTPQDSTHGWQELIGIGQQLLICAIDRLKEVAPVTVVTIPGNHDEQSTFILGRVLAAYYRRDSNVNVRATPKFRAYYEYGTTLLGFTHGKYEKVGERPSIMAREEKDAWARTTHREWHLGHRHKLEMDEIQSVRIRRLPSLSAADGWHARQGYAGLRAMEAYLWEHNTGYAGHINVNFPEELR